MEIDETHKNRQRSRRAIILFVAAAYGFLLLDTLFEHHAGLISLSYQKWIPILFSSVSLPAAVAAGLSRRRLVEKAFQVLMLASVLVGLLGAYFHFRPFLGDLSLLAVHEVPPKLAPLAFVGVGVLGLLTTYKREAASHRDKNRVETVSNKKDLKARLAEATPHRN